MGLGREGAYQGEHLIKLRADETPRRSEENTAVVREGGAWGGCSQMAGVVVWWSPHYGAIAAPVSQYEQLSVWAMPGAVLPRPAPIPKPPKPH